MTSAESADRRLRRNTAFYGLNAVLSRAVSFIMLPVYTHYLTPSDYGVLALLQVVVEIAAVTLTAGTSFAVMRYYFKFEDEGHRNSVLASGFAFELSAAAVGTVGICIAAPWISEVVLKSAAPTSMVRLAGVNFFLAALGGTPTVFQEVRERAGTLTAVSLIRLLLQLSLNIVFVVGMSLNTWGVLWSTFIATVIMNGLLAALMLRHTGFRVQWSVMKDLRTFAWPSQITTAGNFILTFSERFFLGPMWGATVVGIYSLAYQFGFLLLQVGFTPFLQAWNPIRYKSISLPIADRNRQNLEGVFACNVLLLLVAVGISLFAKPGIRLMTAPAYQSAADLIPVVILAYVIAAWTLVVKFGIDVAEQPRYYTYATWASVAVTLGLYVVLIPQWGGWGAAWSTVAGFSVRFALTVLWAEKVWRVEYAWRRNAFLALAATVIASTPWVLPVQSTFQELALGLLGTLAYLGVVWLMLSRIERATALTLLANPKDWLALFRGPKDVV